jgi:hypothetical protein
VSLHAVAAKLGGVGEFDAYPLLSLDADNRTLAFAAALPLLAALPFATAGGLAPNPRGPARP